MARAGTGRGTAKAGPNLSPPAPVRTLWRSSFQRHQPDIRFVVYETEIDPAVVKRERNPIAEHIRSHRENLANLFCPTVGQVELASILKKGTLVDEGNFLI